VESTFWLGCKFQVELRYANPAVASVMPKQFVEAMDTIPLFSFGLRRAFVLRTTSVVSGVATSAPYPMKARKPVARRNQTDHA